MQFIILITILFSGSALAYPNFISKGYHACLTCHYNPFGNGPLNDYGRAVSASAIADRLLIPDSVTDEQLAESSGFFFSKPSQKYLRPSIDYRGMQLDRGIDQDDPDRRYINMQIDLTLTAKFGKKDNYIATFTHGIVPDNSARPINGKTEELNYTREAYVGYRPVPSFGIYVGKMDKVFGIRVPDHNAYSRQATNLSQYSASSGVLLHYGEEKFDFGVQYFDGEGDIEKKDNEQTTGFTSTFEYSIFTDYRIGASFLSEEDINQNKKNMAAFIFKAKVGKASSLMLETGQINNELASAGETSSRYIFMQNHLNIKRGMNFLFTYQYFQADIEKESEIYMFAPGIQYYPWQRVELRAEIQNQRVVDQDTNTPVAADSWSFLGQVHLWF